MLNQKVVGTAQCVSWFLLRGGGVRFERSGAARAHAVRAAHSLPDNHNR